MATNTKRNTISASFDDVVGDTFYFSISIMGSLFFIFCVRLYFSGFCDVYAFQRAGFFLHSPVI